VAVIVAHPDDEALGCGGTIARHADRGDEVSVLFVADGVSARGGTSEERRARQAMAEEAGISLGVHSFTFLGLRDNRLDSMPLLDVIQAIEPFMATVRPRIVYTHHGGDLNVDHRIVHQAAMTALRPLPGSSVDAIFAFETSSSTEWAGPSIGHAFRPDRFVDIAAQLDRKMAALEVYSEEMRPFPHARSREAVRALAVTRGASAGLAAAEAFMTLRCIER
jgi:LmbE family N-acetylglucosaminyl deacetylase